MDDTLFERLLYEEEGPTLDFKREQYRFPKATDEEKSELLKDILGFANAWRRSEAYILIGVEDIRGGRGNVVGIPPSDHLDDHSLQQFVNSLTNRPVLFHYAAFGFEGKQIGVIRIEGQTRPVYLKRPFGKLKPNDVYVRRGSSTDPTKPALPDEIALMGSRPGPQQAELVVEFAEVKGDGSLGTRIPWNAERCDMPPAKSIPDWQDARERGTIRGIAIAALDHTYQTNRNYYRELAAYESVTRLVRPVRLLVRNAGQTAATGVRAELTVPAGEGVAVMYDSDLPGLPKRGSGFPYNVNFGHIQPAFRRSPGDVTIDRNDTRVRIEIECGNLQPGRRVWSDIFYLGIVASGEVPLAGQIFADNLPHPKDFSLTIAANVSTTSMTVAELMALPDPRDEDG